MVITCSTFKGQDSGSDLCEADVQVAVVKNLHARGAAGGIIKEPDDTAHKWVTTRAAVRDKGAIASGRRFIEIRVAAVCTLDGTPIACKRAVGRSRIGAKFDEGAGASSAESCAVGNERPIARTGGVAEIGKGAVIAGAVGAIIRKCAAGSGRAV